MKKVRKVKYKLMIFRYFMSEIIFKLMKTIPYINQVLNLIEFKLKFKYQK